MSSAHKPRARAPTTTTIPALNSTDVRNELRCARDNSSTTASLLPAFDSSLSAAVPCGPMARAGVTGMGVAGDGVGR